jgi:hypothetical protein
MVLLLENLLASIFYFCWELLKHPKMFLKRHFIWKSYRKVFFPFSTIKVYNLDKERIFIEFLLTNWFLRPTEKSIDKNTESVLKVKTALYKAIRFRKIDEESYKLITSGVIECGSHGWELIISILENMTRHFDGFRRIIIEMLDDENGKVRETALLVMGEGGFTKGEKRKYYQYMLNDKNKKVRERANDMIFREGKGFIQETST